MLVQSQPDYPALADARARFHGLRGHHLQRGKLFAIAAPPRRDARQPLTVLAALAAPLWMAATFRAARRPWQGACQRACHRIKRCVVGKVPSRAAGATLKARIWDMLGLHPRANKEEIRQAYKEFVRLSHPDLNGGEAQGSEFTEKFQKLTAEYNRVMELTDDEFWLESFDTGITRMATKRVDGPSLNPWERRFRGWARKNNLLVVDELSDEIDCQKKAKVFLDRCKEDPTLEGCEVALTAYHEAAIELESGQSQPEDFETNESGGSSPAAPEIINFPANATPFVESLESTEFNGKASPTPDNPLLLAVVGTVMIAGIGLPWVIAGALSRG
mmetsp:Transcript_126116/g.351437  ORF Transcript_126116/g.351437 Transcript_126116/m.351437 type:complete len:331 (+) Transcript_126116:45-1037(+)